MKGLGWEGRGEDDLFLYWLYLVSAVCISCKMGREVRERKRRWCLLHDEERVG